VSRLKPTELERARVLFWTIASSDIRPKRS
jgi:hypothetical protein